MVKYSINTEVMKDTQPKKPKKIKIKKKKIKIKKRK